MAFNWQQKGWPNATVNRAALKDELDAFGAAFSRVKAALRKPQNPVALMSALVDEAVKTSAIEGVGVDESVVVSSICKALGLGGVPVGCTKDARAEGVAQMVLAVPRLDGLGEVLHPGPIRNAIRLPLCGAIHFREGGLPFHV